MVKKIDKGRTPSPFIFIQKLCENAYTNKVYLLLQFIFVIWFLHTGRNDWDSTELQHLLGCGGIFKSKTMRFHICSTPRGGINENSTSLNIWAQGMPSIQLY